MTISITQLVSEFGSAALAGNGALFVGAGMSSAAGLPDWWGILDDPRSRAGVPDSLEDAPLVAEYISRSPLVGVDGLRAHVLERLADADDESVIPLHRFLGALPVTEFWTTNYDQLIERACPQAQVVVQDDEVRTISSARPSIVKMHGSVAINPERRWVSPPVLTRGEFERYESEHPRMWALLRAAYMSRTILFLGFSFNDPNIEILLRLARRLGTNVGDRHLTVMRRPPQVDSGYEGWVDYRLHQLKVQDLESSGIRVCEIDDFDELPTVLSALVRRTRPPRVFLSGSDPEQAEPSAEFEAWCDRVSTAIAGTDWELASLGGPSGWSITRAVARVRMAEGRYDPGKLVLHFRSKPGPAPNLEERLGTARYSDLDRDALLEQVLADCRALLAVRGGPRTLEELELAAEAGLSVVPLAASGGAAHDFWSHRCTDPPLIGGQRPDIATWAQLNDEEPVVALRAAVRLLQQGMYEAR